MSQSKLGVETSNSTPAGLKVGNDYTNKALQLRNLWSRNASCAGLDQNLEYAYSLELNPLFTNPQPDGERYFYHSDHLGSSAYITTENGYATQFLAYMPYGETLSEQQNSTNYYSPFKFSAKEKDPETGYSYFGARYYSPELSVWLSIDPLADKAPGWTPYRYGFNNPISFVDPNGMFESKAKAKEYAENNGIRTGWFSGNKIIQNSDGTYSIYNKREGTSYSDLGKEFGGVQRSILVEARGVHLRDIGIHGYINKTDPNLEGYNPNLKMQTDFWDRLYYLGHWVSWTLPSLGVSTGTRAVNQIDDITIQFGKTENQVYHAFRHIEELGLDKSLVQSAITTHFKPLASQVVAGEPFNRIVEIGGHRLQYTAFRIEGSTYNIGRIHCVD